MNFEELQRILEVDDEGILRARKVFYDLVERKDVTEYDLVLHELRLAKTLIMKEREITIPGFERNTRVITKVLAEFKSKEKKNIMPVQFAKSDDIVIMPIRPEHYGLSTFRRTGLTPGLAHIIPTAAGLYTVPEKQTYVITDILEIHPAGNITAIRFVDVDGVPQYPLEARLAYRVADVRIYELPHPIIADSTLDIDAKVEFAGDAELTPIGVWIGYGKDVPKLVL